VILAEAKANIQELGDPRYMCRAEGQSRDRIEISLAMVKNALKAKQNSDWMGDYYQYANRLAHLYFLHILCGIPTWMVFIYILSDERDFHIRSERKWAKGLARIQKTLGLPKHHLLSQQIINVFPEIGIRY